MKLKSYLYSQLALSFYPIFLGLFFITSIVFLVKIASLTSIITINFFELFILYSYVVPQIVFYTMPISFFIALVITLSKLSSEYELIVITSFGLNPVRILKVFFPITLAVSIILLIFSVGLIPKAKFLTKQFLDQKKKEANFNIKASEFGQKFGDWLIYIDSKDDKNYKNIKLFKAQDDKEQFILSENAVLNNDKGELNFNLKDGKAFYVDGFEINQINFDSMHINDSITGTEIEKFTNPYDFWKRKIEKKDDIDDLTFYILTSIFPIISLFLIISFGYYNPRYEKNRAIAYSLVAIVFYYIVAKSISGSHPITAIYVLPVIWFSITYFIYNRTIRKEY